MITLDLFSFIFIFQLVLLLSEILGYSFFLNLDSMAVIVS